MSKQYSDRIEGQLSQRATFIFGSCQFAASSAVIIPTAWQCIVEADDLAVGAKSRTPSTDVNTHTGLTASGDYFSNTSIEKCMICQLEFLSFHFR